MRRVLTVLILFAELASADRMAPVLSPEAHQNATEQIAKILSKHMFKVDRELLTFHYENDPQAGYQPSAYNPKTLQDVQKHLIAWSGGYFSDKSKDTNEVGPGLYLALDPYSTRSYGGTANPQLYVIPVARGARLLDTKTDLEKKDSEIMGAIAKQFHCLKPVSEGSDFATLFTAIRESDNIQCRQIAINAMASTAMQGIFYSYSGVDLPGCRTRGYAIDVISPEILRLDRVALFTDDRTIQGEQVSDQLNLLFSEASKDFTSTYNSSGIGDFNSPPKTLLTLNGNPKAYASWKQQVLYACGKRWGNEKKQDLAFQEFENENFPPDQEIRTDILALRKAFKDRMGDKSFTLTQMNQLEKVQAGGIDVPLDTLVRAKNALQNYQQNSTDQIRRQNAESILGELKPGIVIHDSSLMDREGVKLFFSLWKPHTIQRSLFFRFFLRANWGPRMIRLSLLEITENNGVVQPMSVAAMKDIDLKNKSLQVKNREQFKTMLLTCTAMYQNTALKIDDIQASACGIRQTPMQPMNITN